MKKLIQKAKNLIADGKYDESIVLIKKISKAIKESITVCPNCDNEVVSLKKEDQVHAECPKCGAMWGHKEIKGELLKAKEMAMKKKDILNTLWKFYQEADPDVTPFDINSFDATGWLKKSLAEKVSKELQIPFMDINDLNKSDEDVDKLVKKMSDEAQKWISGKIKFLMDEEGLGQKQAVGKAYGMARQKFGSTPVKKSNALAKDEIVHIMLDMFKNNEEPNIINRHTITRYEATGEITDDALKIVYRKAGKDLFELCKQDKQTADGIQKDGYEGTMVKESVCEKCGTMIKAGEEACSKCGMAGMAKQQPRIKPTTIAAKPGKAGKVTRSAHKDTNLAIRAQKPITKADDDEGDEPWSYSHKNLQRMIDSGQVWRMEGSMGRAAMEGIKSGHLILGPKSHKDYWGNHIPAHHEVKPGTHGSPEYAKEKTGYVHPEHAKQEKEKKIKKGIVRGVPDGTGPYGRGMGAGQGKADGSGLKSKKDLNKRKPSAQAQAKKLKEEIGNHLQSKMYGHNINIMDIGALHTHAEKIHASGKSPEDAATEAFEHFKQTGKIKAS